ncbi:hypothetical protein ACVNP1_08830 [Staphylococcus aureus]
MTILIKTTHLITFIFKQLLFIFIVPFIYPYKKLDNDRWLTSIIKLISPI